MPVNIGDVFSHLRHEKRLSQRKAAQELDVSQALLSHYENGIREPRLEFIVRACDYYGVSADYLFGRTTAKENPLAAASTDDAGALSPWEDDELRSIIASVSELLALLYSVYGRHAAMLASDYLAASIYDAARAAVNVQEERGSASSPLCDAYIKLKEAAFYGDIGSSENGKSQMDNIREEYPQLCELITRTGREIAELAHKGDGK